jgi:glycosyltransferase involved in cell wall biosynthesis
MKIAFVTELFAPSVGGQEVRFEELGAELVKRGVEVNLYTLRHDLSSPRDEVRGGMAVHRITDCAGYKHPRLRRHPWGILKFTWALRQRLAELQSHDAVVFNIWPVLPPLVLGRALRGKAVVDVCETRSGRFWHWIYQRLADLPKVRLLGVSPEIVRHMLRVHGAPSKDAHVAVSGVDLEAAPQPPFAKDPRQIMYFGRLTEHKNPRMLVEAFCRSTLPGRGYRLVVAGGGPELEGLRRDFSNPALDILGRVTDEQKWSLLCASSLLVLPSRREGFPRVVAEAACVGTPTLTLDYPDNGTRFVVQDYGVGRSVDATEQALVAALEQFAAAPQEWAALGSGSLKRARDEFGWEPVTTRLLNFLTLERN